MFAKIKELLSRFSKLFGTLTLSFHTPVRIQKLTHVFLFLLSLLFSIAFWCFVSYNSEVKAVKTLYVPVQYVGMAPWLDKKASVDVVRVRVSGREKALLGFSADALKAVVNLKGETVGTYTKDITVTSSASNVNVSRIYPHHCDVTIYRTMKRVLPVLVNFADNVVSRNISDIVITPPQIVISGNEETVKSVSELNVLVDTSKLDTNGNVTLPIIIKGVAEDLVSDTDLVLSQKNVEAHVVFDDDVVSKELPLKYALVGQPQNKIVITKATLLPATIKVKAKASFFKKVKEINLGNVDISNIHGTTSIPVPFVVSDELKNPTYEAKFDAPNVIRLNLLCKENLVKKFYENVPIKLIGLDSSKWTLSSKTAVVCVEANAATFSNLKEELPFEVFVDATDVVNKKISLPVSFKSKKNDIRLLTIEPSMITITHE